MSFSELEPHQQVQEILGFAKAFQAAVFAKNVYRSELDGGGYALTSCVRPDYHIPTGTAPSTIALQMTMFKDAHGESDDIRGSYLVGELQRAVGLVESVGKIIDADPYGFPVEYKGISERISQDLPEMKKAVNLLSGVNNLVLDNI